MLSSAPWTVQYLTHACSTARRSTASRSAELACDGLTPDDEAVDEAVGIEDGPLDVDAPVWPPPPVQAAVKSTAAAAPASWRRTRSRRALRLPRHAEACVE
jgi:hypothetical protein